MTHHQPSQFIAGRKRPALVADNGEGQLQHQRNDTETDEDLKYLEERAFPLPRHDRRHATETRFSDFHGLASVYRRAYLPLATGECCQDRQRRNFLKRAGPTFSRPSAAAPTDRFHAPFSDSDGSKVLPAPNNPFGSKRL